MNGSAKDILQSLEFLFMCVADLEDDQIDDKERLCIELKLSEWLGDQNYLPEGMVDSKKIAESRFAKHMEDGYPVSNIHQTVEFLAANLSPSNLSAAFQDLVGIAECDGEIGEKENFILENISTEWSIDLENNPPSKRLRAGHFCHAFRYTKDRELSDVLRETFQLNSLYPLIKPLENQSCLNALNENTALGHGLNKHLAPRLSRLVEEIRETLGFEEKVSFFVANEPIKGAWISGGVTPGGENYVTLTSELIRALSDDELRSVIGHEIGHALFNTNDINLLLNVAYDGEDSSPSISLDQLLSTWKKCVEFSADRVGLVACGCKVAAINALYRVSTGLKPEDTGFVVEDYLDALDQELDGAIDFELFRNHSHPPLPIRIKALNLFAESDLYKSWKANGTLLETDRELREGMAALVKKVDYSSDDPLHATRLLALTLGGLYIARSDEEIHPLEIEKIESYLRIFILDPGPVIRYAIEIIKGGESLGELLSDLLRELAASDEEEKYHLMNFYMEVATGDGKLQRSETRALLEIGEFLGLPDEGLLKVLARHLGSGNLFERQVPEQVDEILGRAEPFLIKPLEDRLRIAADKATDEATLKQLAEDADSRVRATVLRNPATSEDIRRRLMNFPSVMQHFMEEEEEE